MPPAEPRRQLPRTPLSGSWTSENSYKAKFAEYPFHALRCIVHTCALRKWYGAWSVRVLLQLPATLHLQDQPSRRPLHDPEVPLPKPRVGLVAHAAQGALEASVGEHESRRAVAAHVRLACHPKILAPSPPRPIPHGPGVTGRLRENSEVSPLAVFVAVALTSCPTTAPVVAQEKLASPLAPVCTLVSCATRI
jgi:hypothetical protein